jgi:diphosphomevalonate decarboxylase
MKNAIAAAPANIAFIKYWGKKNDALNLPWSDTISMNLSNAQTKTSVTFEPALDSDRLMINGKNVTGKELERASKQLDLIRARAGIELRAKIESANSFPSSAGIASSASGFAALTVAAAAAAGLEFSEKALSAIARRGSGSAARSVPNGFVVWHAAETDGDSFAETLHPVSHWKLHDVIVVVEQGKKAVGSTEGHGLAPTSPLFRARIDYLPQAIKELKSALAARDIEKFGRVIEAETLNMHAVMMTSTPSLLYWKPNTLAVIEALHELRSAGTMGYFTIDAGANVHVICEDRDAGKIKSFFAKFAGVNQVIDNLPAEGAHLL